MAKRNSSGPSSGRRGASRGKSEGGSYSGKRKSSDKPFRKSDSGNPGRSSSFSKGGSFRKKDDSFQKSDRPYGRKRDEDSSSSGKRPYGNKREGFSSDSRGTGGSRPYKKSDKPYGKREEGSSGPRGRSFGNKRGGFSSDSERSGEGRDFKKSNKPYGKRSGSSSEGRGGKFKKGPSYGLPYKRSYDKGERGDSSEDKSYGNKKSSFSKEPNQGRFKKFNTTDSPKPYRRKNEDGNQGEEKPSRFSRKSSDKSYSKPERGSRPSREKQDAAEESGFFKKSKSRYADKPVRSSIEETSAPAQTDKIRLNKYIANSGVCSRREADELITMGLISVNGKTITELGYKVNPGDEVRYENKVLTAEKPVYILLNKPKGYLTTTDDPQERNTVMHIIGNAVKERIYPVGRLDRNTTGLLLLTNDGDLADKLMHPSYNIKKIYKVELDRPLTKADFQTISEGVVLEEGRAAVDDLAIVSEDGKTIGVELHIGWNRVVRRIFESLQYEVVRLDRAVYAGLDKKDLGRGEWRFLSKEEIIRLKHYK